jgi:hypothetical protein
MDEYQLEIAGITLSIASPYPIDPKSIREIYRPFFKKDPLANSHPHLRVHFVFDDFPHTPKYKEVFDSGQSWSMHQEEGEYHIHFDPRKDGSDPYWQARFNADCTMVTVNCSDEMLIQNGEQQWIKNPLQYPLDQLLAVFHIASRKGALIHAAGAIINGRGLLFPGRSGAGKSTITRQFATAKRDFELLSDDRIIVRKIDDAYTMFGTPWPGEAGIAKNTSHPLHGIAFIHHGTKNEIKEIDPKIALKQLLPVVSIPWYDEAIMLMIVDFCEGLVTTIPTYELHFKPDVEIANFLEDFLNESA